MIMPDGHWPEMAQVTAVDDQFGTHKGWSRHANTWLSTQKRATQMASVWTPI